MSTFLNLPSPPLPPPLLALRAAAIRQEPGSGYSANIRPLRARRSAATHQPNPLLLPSSPSDPCPQNETMLQGFEWYVPHDGQHWRRLARTMPYLASLGVTKVWIPPACKAARPEGNGYDVYDLWDLGEFEQKGCRGTKWGTREELVALGEAAQGCGVGLLFDAVLNHKTGADYKEAARGRRVDGKDRLREVGGGGGQEEEGIEAWTGFEFAGRGGRYSRMKWAKEHFTGVDYDDLTRRHGAWKLDGKEWAEDVDEELGNYDFLWVLVVLNVVWCCMLTMCLASRMFSDIDHKHPEVRADIFRWIEWLPKQVELGGLRLDAIKHYSFRFQREFLTHIKQHVNPEWFIVGEYWREDSEYLAKFIEYMDNQLSLFDVQLVSNFSKVSMLGDKGDLRKVFDDSLVLWKPDNAVVGQVHDSKKRPETDLGSRHSLSTTIR